MKFGVIQQSFSIILMLLISLPSFALRTPSSLDIGKMVSPAQDFALDYSKSSWKRNEIPANLQEQVVALFKLKDKTKNLATFTVRIDEQTKLHSLREYTEKWIKSYTQFGMEVLGHQTFKNKNDVKGMVIDLTSENSRKKIRQVIFFRNSKAIVLTCMDQREEFANTLKKCNELVENFDWIEKGSPSENPLKI